MQHKACQRWLSHRTQNLQSGSNPPKAQKTHPFEICVGSVTLLELGALPGTDGSVTVFPTKTDVWKLSKQRQRLERCPDRRSRAFPTLTEVWQIWRQTFESFPNNNRSVKALKTDIWKPSQQWQRCDSFEDRRLIAFLTIDVWQLPQQSQMFESFPNEDRGLRASPTKTEVWKLSQQIQRCETFAQWR